MIMDHCTRCGARAGNGWRFCGTCGGPIGGGRATSDLDAPTTVLHLERSQPRTGRHARPAPGAVAPWPTATPLASPGAMWERFRSGDWAGALTAVLAGSGAMVGLAALVVAAVASSLPVTLPVGQIVAIMMMVVASAAGGSVSASAGGSLGGTSLSSAGAASISVVPLTITLAGFTVMTWVFLRRLPVADRSLVGVGLAAARTWVILMAVLAAVALVGRATVGAPTGADSATASAGASSSSSASFSATVTVDLVATLVFATGWLALFLALGVAWRRPDVLSPALRRRRDLLTAPAAGVATTLGLAWLATAGLVLVAVVTGETSATSGSLFSGAASTGTAEAGAVVVALLMAPNILLGVFGFALGVPVRVGNGLGSGSPSIDLLTLTDHGAQYWLVALLAAGAVLAGGIVTALRCPTPQYARRHGWQFGIALGLTLCVVAVDTAVSAGVVGIGSSAGLDPVLAVIAGLVWGTVAGFLGAGLAAGLPPNTNAQPDGQPDGRSPGSVDAWWSTSQR